MQYLLLIFGMVVLALSLPVLLPLLAVMDYRDRRRRERAASTTPCAVCGALLGPQSLARADAAWAEFAAALHAERPHVKYRLVRHVWAICVACDARYAVDGSRLVLRAEAGL